MRLIEKLTWERSSEDGGVYVCPFDLTNPCEADVSDLIELKKVIDESLRLIGKDKYKSGVYCSDCGKQITEEEYSCGECSSCKGFVDCEENIVGGK